LNPDWRVGHHKTGCGLSFCSQENTEASLTHSFSGGFPKTDTVSVHVWQNLSGGRKLTLYKAVFADENVRPVVPDPSWVYGDPESLHYLINYIDQVAKPVIEKKEAEERAEEQEAQRRFWK